MGNETELIKDRLNLADVISEYVQLKRAGNHFKALCPFHQEKTPSFIVSPDKGIWHCFGCNSGGDLFSFVQQIEGLDFLGALKLLAERAGVELRPLNDAQGKQARGKQRLYNLLALAARFYQEILLRQKAGARAKQYLNKRGVRRQTMDLFQLGYAPSAWDGLQKYLRTKKFTSDEMIAAGVVGKSTTGKLYDRFRGRIIFPITDVQGRIVAFGGRIVPWHESGNEGKYINSPETTLYEKRRTVYNLSRAKQAIRDKKSCVVVEGYMDAVMSHQAGIPNVVGSSGTAFTEEHVQQLARFTDTLHFAFDADRAGWKAALGATRAALTAGLRVAIILLPSGKDPADIAATNPKQLVAAFARPQTLISALLDQLAHSPDAGTKEEQLEALLPLIGEVQNPVHQGEMIQEVAAILHVPESHVISAVQERARTGEKLYPIPESGEVWVSAPYQAEYQLLGLLIIDRQAREEVFGYLEEDFLIDGSSRKLYKTLQGLADSTATFSRATANEILSLLAQEDVPFAESVRLVAQELIATSSRTPVQEAKTLLRHVQRKSLEKRLQEAQRNLTASGQAERVEALKRFQSLAEELAHTRSDL